MTTKSAPLVLDSLESRTLHALHAMGGAVEHEGGFATRILSQKVGEAGDTSRASVPLKALEEYGLITREMKGKRTYRIQLTEQGINSADQLDDFINGGGTPIEEMSLATLMEELDRRISDFHDPEDCEAELMKRKLDTITADVTDLDEGRITWLECITNIKTTLRE